MHTHRCTIIERKKRVSMPRKEREGDSIEGRKCAHP
jgi:hypothetical protein